MNDIKSLREHFTHEELEALRKYVEDVKTWKAKEPKQLTEEERTQIYTYGAAHEWTPPEEYKGRVIFESYIDLEDGCDPEHPTYDYYIVDTEYDFWKYDIYRIAPVNTIVKLLYYISEANKDAKNVLFGYAPEDEDNRQQIERAIMELLGENVTKEDAQIVAAISVKYSKNTAIPIFTDKTTKDYTRQIFQVPNQNELAWKINGELDIKDPEKPEILQKALDRQYKGNYNRELLETIGAGIQKLYETEGATPILQISRMNLANFLGITIRKPTTEIIEAIRRGDKEIEIEREDKDGNKITRKADLLNEYSFWYDLLNLERATGFLEMENGAFYRAFTFNGYDPNTDTLKCSTPFLYEAYKENHKKRIVSKTMHNNIPDYEIEKIAFLLRGSIVKIRSTATKEIIRHLIYGISNRGALRTDLINTNNTGAAAKDKQLRSYVISYRGLIENCPALYNQLYPIDENGNIKNIRAANKITILKRAIYGNDYTIS